VDPGPDPDGGRRLSLRVEREGAAPRRRGSDGRRGSATGSPLSFSLGSGLPAAADAVHNALLPERGGAGTGGGYGVGGGGDGGGDGDDGGGNAESLLKMSKEFMKVVPTHANWSAPQ
jgi:hypothetical protein